MILTSTVDFMDVVDWSRGQFAMTAIYHWLFVPLTLGLSFICAFMETAYYRTGDEFWKRTAKFWMKLFGINFAIGVATGIILEFEFGTNWSNYSHFVGDIFGAPLAIEGIMAFFMESTFIAVMFFGWNKVSKGFHLASTWLTAIGANLSALWILVANSWMQYPVGTAFDLETARNVMTSFWDVLLSPVAMNKFFHTVTSAYVLASVFVLGVSAWFLLKKREERFAKASMKIASIFGLASAVMVVFTGDTSSQVIAEVQPMKLAAIEGLYDGKEGADMVVIGVLKPEEKIKPGDDPFYFGVRIPKLLSILSFRDSGAYVAGINDLIQGNEEHGLMSASEKIERGRVVLGELGKYHDAKKVVVEGRNVVAEVIERKVGNKNEAAEIMLRYQHDSPEGRELLSGYFADSAVVSSVMLEKKIELPVAAVQGEEGREPVMRYAPEVYLDGYYANIADMNNVLTKFSPETPEGKVFLKEYFKYFGYGYLSSPDDLKLMVPLLFYCYRFMVGSGFFFVLLFIVALWFVLKDTIGRRRVWLYIMLWSIPVAYIASQAGWAVAEVGRQPWTIQDLLPTVAAVSKIDSGSVIVTFFLFVALFTTLLIAEIMIMTKQIKLGPKNE